MIYNYCNHTEGKCPCLTCAERDCPSCDGTGPGKYGVDTDRLCGRASAYCEGGRREGGFENTFMITRVDTFTKILNI